MTDFTFMMLLDDSASSMLKATMVDGMGVQFPSCSFETGEAPNLSLVNSIIPIIGVASTGDGEGSWIKPVPDQFRASVTEAFDDLLREARAAQLS
jgi:hypothetical protein